GPVEAGDETARVLELELRCDFFSRSFVCSCRQRDAWNVREALRQNLELAILWPEIVPPLRDTMRLVDGEQSDLGPPEQRQGPVLQQSFRRNVEDIHSTRSDPGFERILFPV